jgi:hypothetical protein
MAQLIDFFQSFEAKDWITFFASLAAFVMSLLSFFQKTREGQQSLRKQLTEVLQKLSDFNIEVAKFNSLPDKTAYPPNFRGLISDQRRFLTRQAAYFSERIPDLVSPYEYLVMAWAFDDTDDVEQADHFFDLASRKQRNKIDQGIALRSYARFQFSQHLLDEGRANYNTALACFQGESDRLCFYRGVTYERWADQEDDWSNRDKATQLLQLAKTEYTKIKKTRRRDSEVRRVEERILGRKSPVADTTPGTTIASAAPESKHGIGAPSAEVKSAASNQ